MFRENQRIVQLLLKAVDLLLVAVSFSAAYGVRFFLLQGVRGPLGEWTYGRMLLLSLPVYTLLYHGFELYRPGQRRTLVDEVERIFTANLLGLVYLFVLAFLVRMVDLSRLMIVLFAAINTSLTCLLRVGMRAVLRARRRRGFGLSHILLVGWNELAADFCDKLTADPSYGVQVVGYMGRESVEAARRGIPYRGPLFRLETVLEGMEAEEVVISLDYDEFALMGSVIEVCDRQGVKSSLLPFYAKYLPAHPYVDELDGLPLINLHRIPLDNLWNEFLKRTFDIAASGALLVLLSPVFLAAAVGIRLSSPGPVVYRQQRVGRGKRLFTMYKFRSMQVEGNEDMTTWGGRSDSRRTRFGAFLRKFSIDELPQLVNVLKGDMSLVGPRPERPFFVEKFRDEVPLYMLKHLVRPGITGWAQVNGWRGDTSIVERVKCDLFYIENWSLLLDIKILLLTLVRGVVNPSEDL